MTGKEIFSKLKEIDSEVCIRMHSNAAELWYLDFRNTMFGGFTEHSENIASSGQTTEDLLLSFWKRLTADHTQNPNHFLVVYAHPDGPPINGHSQAWVRWDEKQKDWIDVEPTKEALKTHNIARGSILSYMDEDIHYQG